MFKRVTWLGAGLVTGFVASKWVERKARRRLARYFPARFLPARRATSAPLPLSAGAELADKAREIAVAKIADLRTAVDEGRTTMVAREAELRRQWKLDEPGEQVKGGRSDAVGAKQRSGR
jgi:hypothetical protein